MGESTGTQCVAPRRTGWFQKRRLLTTALAAISWVGLVGIAEAEDYKTPPRVFVDPLGIDLASGSLVRSDTYLTIGDPSAGGLSWTFHAHSIEPQGDFRGYVGGACTDPPPVFSDPSCDGSLDYILVWIGDSATTFEPTGTGTYDNWSGTAATLTSSGGVYTFTEGDGTIYTLTSTALTSIKHPNGMQITISYSGGVPVSAVSNTGFAFKFEKNAGATSYVKAYNTVAHGCEGAPLTCTSPDSQIGLTGASVNFTIADRAGKNWNYVIKKKFSYTDPVSDEIINGPRTLWTFTDPTGYSINTFRTTHGELTKVVDPRGEFEYSILGSTPSGGDSYAAGMCSPYSHLHTANDCTTSSPYLVYTGEMNAYSGVSSFYKDGILRQTSYGIGEYDHGTSGLTGQPIAKWTRLLSATKPEGDYVTYTYDARGNITSAVRTGAGTSPLTQSFTASFPSTCTNPVTCNQPTWTKDALGYQTDYTYDTTHGGVLTVTLPEDKQGYRKKTFNTYTAFNTGYGTIYRLTNSETCGLDPTQLSTLTSCPSNKDTSVTQTTYGTSTTAPYTYKSFQPYTVTQTDKSTTGALVATTTYGYDILGNVVAVDGPRTDVSDISYKTYDASRQVVCEISADPDGSSSLNRMVLRHIYDDAGRETETDTGYGSSTTSCSGMTIASYKKMTLDAVGRVVKTETWVTP